MASGHAVSLKVAGVAINGCFHRFARYSRLIHLPVAIDAPAHAEVLNLPYTLHCFHWPVTSLALHSGIHVNAVVEVNVIGKFMHLDPGHRVRWLAGVWLHFSIEAHRFIQLSEFRRNSDVRLPVFPLCLLVLGADGPQRSDYKAMAIHAYIGGGKGRRG